MELFKDPEFWIAISFAIAVGVLWVKGKALILGGLDARAHRIKAELEEARRLREEAERTLADYQRKQRDALAEAQGIVAQATADAERVAAQAAADLEASLKRREQQAKDKIAQAEARAIAEVRNHAIDVAIDATRQVLKQSLTEAQGAALIDAAIAELPRLLH